MPKFGLAAYTKYLGGGVRAKKQFGAAAWRGGAHVWFVIIVRFFIVSSLLVQIICSLITYHESIERKISTLF